MKAGIDRNESLGYRPVLRRVEGSGGTCCDEQGNKYVDLRMAFGGVLLGYAYAPVNEAIVQQIGRGVLFSTRHPLQEKLRDRLAGLFACTRGEGAAVLLRKTGSEAVAAAVRLARAYTRRETVLRCGYHGWHDWCADGVLPRFYGDKVGGASIVPMGVPAAIAKLAVRFDANDLNAVEDLLATRGHEVACAVIAPEDVLPPVGETLMALRELVDRHGTLLVLDEVKTAFRGAIGGMQTLLGVVPDLTALSKGLANGMPLAATLGRPDVMALESKSFLSSTYAGELASIAAAHATLNAVVKEDVIGRLWRLGQRFIEGFNAAIARSGIGRRAIALGWPVPSMPFVHLLDPALSSSTFEDLVMQSGTLIYSTHMNFPCFRHSEDDIDRAVGACVSALEKMTEGSR